MTTKCVETVDARFVLAELRAHLARMTDTELLHFAIAAKHMMSAEAHMGDPPPEVYAVQLREAREEWMRRLRPRLREATQVILKLHPQQN